MQTTIEALQRSKVSRPGQLQRKLLPRPGLAENMKVGRSGGAVVMVCVCGYLCVHLSMRVGLCMCVCLYVWACRWGIVSVCMCACVCAGVDVGKRGPCVPALVYALGLIAVAFCAYALMLTCVPACVHAYA